MRRVGAEQYDVYIPLEDPVTFRNVVEWLTREAAELSQLPGGELLRTEILDQLHTANELFLSQSPRQAGIDVNNTGRMRQIVEQGIRDGRYPPDFIEAYDAAGGRTGWPRTPQGRGWEVDHVFELWKGGEDNVYNYLPLDPRVHQIKTGILARFRAAFRDAHRTTGEQVDVHGEL